MVESSEGWLRDYMIISHKLYSPHSKISKIIQNIKGSRLKAHKRLLNYKRSLFKKTKNEQNTSKNTKLDQLNAILKLKKENNLS